MKDSVSLPFCDCSGAIDLENGGQYGTCLTLMVNVGRAIARNTVGFIYLLYSLSFVCSWKVL